MQVLNRQFPSIEQAAGEYLENRPKEAQVNKGLRSFAEVFEDKKTEDSKLKFSKHATQRLDDRNIELTEEQSQRLEEGVMKASAKGITDSLVLVDTLAFIVNVPNNTVVTAMDSTEATDNVFTNIDGAVII